MAAGIPELPLPAQSQWVRRTRRAAGALRPTAAATRAGRPRGRGAAALRRRTSRPEGGLVPHGLPLSTLRIEEQSGLRCPGRASSWPSSRARSWACSWRPRSPSSCFCSRGEQSLFARLPRSSGCTSGLRRPTARTRRAGPTAGRVALSSRGGTTHRPAGRMAGLVRPTQIKDGAGMRPPSRTSSDRSLTIPRTVAASAVEVQQSKQLSRLHGPP
mmetsp:Transcript_131691/g.409349  ORF Transcript_131691/g.409349 Transcript_131691/m.409349 type:complete len:215 (+) Transcript_131691:200-844(+)